MTDVKNAIITSAELNIGDGGFLECWIRLDFNEFSQGFGGCALYPPKSFIYHKWESLAGHFITRCMQVAGVECWSQLAGKAVRVRGDHRKIDAIGHIVKEDWFCPSEDFFAAFQLRELANSLAEEIEALKHEKVEGER